MVIDLKTVVFTIQTKSSNFDLDLMFSCFVLWISSSVREFVLIK